MEIQLSPGHHARLADLAEKTGRPETEIVQELIDTYLDEVDHIRDVLQQRLDAVERGSVKPLSAEELWNNLERRKKDFLRQRP